MPVPQPLNLIVGWASRPHFPEKNRQDACSTATEFDCGVGVSPAFSRKEQARCLFHND
ncbi:MAG: hypothetical protein QQW96_21860 [Tychonema bourrellyi B0820]|uniref:hypothetical protein n=1 Tax=Tychonema bourrellyi TaxID=54313 RepID=UPI0015D4CF95|nr:hypothetical protein [Tychonema bourrellyi]MDQ2100281.1 hypothetical protein [Tychonema bourrellyi B0820]